MMMKADERAKKLAGVAFEQGKQAGIKEVVDWIISKSVNLQAYSHPVVCIGAGDWIAKLKEWGIKRWKN